MALHLNTGNLKNVISWLKLGKHGALIKAAGLAKNKGAFCPHSAKLF
jgi:hypothetical protein